ncbi:hypothetical protein GGX14DRAFT_567485 [Mycena pura]|uniref:Uncharacterized protein n=1 Tax=Mycena pura TaxID=153505 RepID=A0AAD6YBK5_9AGAR|nr:hypothetical protein GGX14DRAFT_567485 [Mycena pura]
MLAPAAPQPGKLGEAVVSVSHEGLGLALIKVTARSLSLTYCLSPSPAITGMGKRKRSGHCGKGEATTAKKMGQYLAEDGVYQRGQKKIEKLTAVFELDLPFPDHFTGWKRDRKLVAQKAAEGGWLDPSELPDITTNDRLKLFIKTKDPTPEQLEKFGPNHAPKWLAIRFPDVIPPKTQQKLLASWDRVIAIGLRFPKATTQRSSTPAVHLGVWSLFSTTPYITADSRQKVVPRNRTSSSILLARTKEKQVTAQLDVFLGIIKKSVVPKLESLVDWEMGEGTRIRHRVHQRVQAALKREFSQRPNLDFGGLFLAIAVKEGSSEVLHVDWNDNLQTYAIVFCIGDYVGGEFCIPQIGRRIPLRPGAVLAVRTRLLAHCTHVGSGRRVVITCFTDSTLLEQTITGDFAFL